jgi:uncharacterized protein (TIGR03437 family)
MTRLSPIPVFFLLLAFGCFHALGQTSFLSCEVTPTPLIVRAEGLTEKTGDINLKCMGGAPNERITGNIVLFLSAPITNRITAGNVTDVIFTIDNGGGPQSANVPGVLVNSSAIDFNGVSFTLSSQGTADLRFSEVRVDVTSVPLAPVGSVTAQVTFNPGVILAVPPSLLTVARPRLGLYSSLSDNLVCFSKGSPLPGDLSSLAAFLAAKTEFTSTRVTEGFADALAPRSYDVANLNADSGQRIVVKYSGFPTGARLFVPTVVAGSDAVQPTAGGDLGVPASGGKYMPGDTGSLLLATVPQARPDGSGGTPAYLPGAPGSGTVAFDAMSEITLVNGSGAAVYEVVDANPHIQESAQFPTFLGLAPTGGGTAVVTAETVSLAPVSNAGKATASDPIPRYVFTPAPPDCGIVGDCDAKYFPMLSVDTKPLQYSAPAGSGHQIRSIFVNNHGSGLLNWKATVQYTNGSGWLVLFPGSAANNATIRVDAVPGNLAPGTYTATITIDAGPIAGTKVVPVTLVVTTPTPIPTITAVVNAASFAAGPVVPGSLTTLMGMNLGGKSVAATFDGSAAQILFDSDSQINLLVPASLTGKTTAQLIVTSDGLSSAAQAVMVAPFSPAIFNGAILNQDNTVNRADNPANGGTVIQAFATGLSGSGTVTAKVGNETITHLNYAGPAPGFSGVQQVNLRLPHDLMGPVVNVVLCGGGVCGPPAAVNVAP